MEELEDDWDFKRLHDNMDFPGFLNNEISTASQRNQLHQNDLSMVYG
jgi:hypothetical protein